MKTYIAIDLELEQPNTDPKCPDSLTDKEVIIQLGVVFNKEGIIGNFCWNIHYPHKLSNFIEKLTNIKTKEVNESTLTIQQAVLNLQALREEHGCERTLIAWGAGDQIAIEREINMPLSSFGFGRTAFNVAHLYKVYCWAYERAVKSGGLKKAAKVLNVKPESFKVANYNNVGYHNACYDSYVTALVFNKLVGIFKGC